MDILLILVGVLFGVGVTFLGLAINARYGDWRKKQNWIRAGKEWTAVLEHMQRPVYFEQTPEERALDLEARLSMIGKGELIDVSETIDSLHAVAHPARLPKHERDEHAERIAKRQEALEQEAYVQRHNLRHATPDEDDLVTKYI